MLKTEMRNPKTTHIDRMSSEQIVRVIQDENKYAVQAIDTELAAISAAVDAIVRRMKEGGRLFYVGCGTSGRIGIGMPSHLRCRRRFGHRHYCRRGSCFALCRGGGRG